MSRLGKVLLGAALVVATPLLLLRFVVPTFANLFLGLGVELPVPAWFVMRFPYLFLFTLFLVVVVLPIIAIVAGLRLMKGRPAQQ